MSEHLRALSVILVLATLVYAFAKAPACAAASTAADFERRRNLWYALTLAAFLATDYWIFTGCATVLLLIVGARDPNRVAVFFFVLLAIPPIEVKIPGLGLVEQLFSITHARLLAFTLLLPAWLSLRKQPQTEPFGRTIADRFVAGYLVLGVVLNLAAGGSLTNNLRLGVFYPFIDIFLPYYVASRGLTSLRSLRDALMAFVVAAMVLCPMAAFELVKGWLLYVNLDEALNVPWWSNYLSRGEQLRAQVSAGHSLPLGYVIATAIGLTPYLRKLMPPLPWLFGMMVLGAGLLAPLSRGPWVGVAFMLVAFLAAGPKPMRHLVALGALSLLCLPLLLTPAGQTALDHLPFVGSVDSQNVTYRQKLLEISSSVIMQRPWFGAFDFYLLPEMQELKQGQGIIDVVNTYLNVGLERGLTGLTLFTGFFIAIAVGLYRTIRSLDDHDGEVYLLGQTLLATLLGVMLIIFTVSSISVVAVVYWSIAGACAAYIRMVAMEQRSAAPAPAAMPQPALRAGVAR
jgi:hypothetical protein